MRAIRAFRNAFLSPGRRLFGWRFSRDYLRFSWRAARSWGDTRPGTLPFLGYRVDYVNRSDALFLMHEIFVNAAYAFETTNRAPRIVDCGANVGMGVLFFKALWPEAEVLAIEADPRTFARLTRTIERNGLTGVQAENAAVGLLNGAVSFYSSPSDLGSMVGSVEPSWGGGARQEVPGVRLSALIGQPVDFLKLDVEGAEYDVVRDLIETGAIRWVNEAVVEYHELAGQPDAVARMMDALRAEGFDVRVTASSPQERTGMLRLRKRVC